MSTHTHAYPVKLSHKTARRETNQEDRRLSNMFILNYQVSAMNQLSSLNFSLPASPLNSDF
ncbi:uncharacterized protein EAF01_001533 [Botrytis porri]|uniref:uncharacterized protein n=1 Tax=Botrytis porri TaxID=87229 RepID=UPI0019002B63|nr:uncharacterized protein EAF01_001533 [Botrytis porri]KAF7912512.1 hypothetical protein EAF01_001533 [Botrytis porri]